MRCWKCSKERDDLHGFGHGWFCPEHCPREADGFKCNMFHPEGVSDVPEPILSQDYWRGRLQSAQKGELHHAIFKCAKDKWDAIAERHRQILKEQIKPTDSVLDCGCGWGRLLELLPADWHGRYMGVDISPDFIALAREICYSPAALFVVGDLRELWKVVNTQFDIAILISVRPMVVRNLDQQTWDTMEVQIRKVARKLLFLEYDPTDSGSME